MFQMFQLGRPSSSVSRMKSDRFTRSADLKPATYFCTHSVSVDLTVELTFSTGSAKLLDWPYNSRLAVQNFSTGRTILDWQCKTARTGRTILDWECKTARLAVQFCAASREVLNAKERFTTKKQ